jgi:DNA polymerase
VGEMMVFYDFEVFKYDWLVVFIDLTEKKETVIINNPEQLRNFYESHNGTIWAGYNSRNYDQYILKGILCGFNPKDVNDWIIVEDKPGYRFSSLFRNFPVINYDVMPNPPISLKTLEAFMGHSIKETSIPFNIDRPLTEEELRETVKYCRHDVEETVEVWLRRKEDEFDAQMSLVKAFHLPASDIGRTKAQLSAKILGAVYRDHDDEFELQLPETLRIEKYTEVLNWYKNPLNRDYSKTLEIDIAGVPHVFAWGGLHGAIPQYFGEGSFINVDVASYYPSLMLVYKWLSRNVADPSKYAEIYHTRLKLKAEKNPMQQPYKIVLNSTYGAMKDRHNAMYDPRQANNVCVGGQLLLLDLIERLEDHCDIIQSNTDGILVKLRHDDDFELIDDICWEWEKRTGMRLEFDEFQRVFQKDVNNYLIVPAGPLLDEKGKPRWKCKGAYVKKLSDLDYDLPIVNRAIVNYFLHDIPPEQTIMECSDLRDFQKVVKVSSKYKYAIYSPVITLEKIRDDKGRLKTVKRFSGGEVQTDKTFRVFASTDHSKGGIFKVSGKIVKGREKNPEQFANTPEHCFIVNGDVNGVPIPDELDKAYYIKMAWDRLKDFGIERIGGGDVNNATVPGLCANQG